VSESFSVSPARATTAGIDLTALRHNLARVRALAPRARVMAVIKADGYGHGAATVARALSGADGFAVARVEEGVRLREAGVEGPVCVLSGFHAADELPELAVRRLSPLIHSAYQIELLERLAQRPGLRVWLKLDTGMHRLGFTAAEGAAAWERLRRCPAVSEVGLMSHLANADDVHDAATRSQIEVFETFRPAGAFARSLANSAGVVAWPDSHQDWVRPGIMLYGVSPLKHRSGAELGLRPAMSFQSRLVAVRALERGERVGYGGDFVCPEDMKVGVVGCGYGDGYPRHVAPGTCVAVNGRLAPIVGRVSMDLMSVDLRGHPEAAVRAPVVLWGETPSVEYVARQAGTIAYELLCGVSARVPRIYVNRDS
jgi:alanine racemase